MVTEKSFWPILFLSQMLTCSLFSSSQQQFMNAFSQLLTKDTGFHVEEGFQLWHRMNKPCCLYYLGCSLHIKTVWNFDLWPAQIVGWRPPFSLFTSPFHLGQKKSTKGRHVWTLMLSLSLFLFHFSLFSCFSM